MNDAGLPRLPDSPAFAETRETAWMESGFPVVRARTRCLRPVSSVHEHVPSSLWKTPIVTCSSSSATRGRRPSRLPTAFQHSNWSASSEPNWFGRVGPSLPRRNRVVLRRCPTPRSTCSRLEEPRQLASMRTRFTRTERPSGAPARARLQSGVARKKAVMESSTQAEVSFERDVRPLFRERDRGAMLGVAKFDLWNRDHVAEHSQDILKRLDDGSMPCDQAWPDEQVAIFRRWVEAGMPA